MWSKHYSKPKISCRNGYWWRGIPIVPRTELKRIFNESLLKRVKIIDRFTYINILMNLHRHKPFLPHVFRIYFTTPQQEKKEKTMRKIHDRSWNLSSTVDMCFLCDEHKDTLDITHLTGHKSSAIKNAKASRSSYCGNVLWKSFLPDFLRSKDNVCIFYIKNSSYWFFS